MSRPRTRAPRGGGQPLHVVRDPDRLASHLEDAAHFPGGHAVALAQPDDEAGVAEALRRGGPVLPIGAQSSLTGGATPFGGILLDTSRLNRIESIGTDRVRVQAGVSLAALDAALAAVGKDYPPAPTFTGAFVGGTIATNAAGAATFKYGTTRDWVLALTVVLPDGDVLDIERGEARADEAGVLTIERAGGLTRVNVPSYRMPQVPKLSAGYFAAPGMDLVDLFVGSEGTLGVVTAATLRVLAVRPARCLALVPFASAQHALAFVRELSDLARDTWRSGDPAGVDVSAIEHMDERALTLAREDGADRAAGVKLPVDTRAVLLVTLELPPDTGATAAFEAIGRAGAGQSGDTPLGRFCASLARAGVLEAVEIAVPGDHARAGQLLAFREAVPEAVNRRVGHAKHTVDVRIEKTAGDVIVPVDRLAELVAFCDDECERRGLDLASWGHISDGNLHPNVIPHSYADVESGKAAMLAIGRESLRLGGAPLAEHGVGRNLIKQQLLREMYGERGIDDMRRVKRALDPRGMLAPGVIFQA